MAAQILQLLAAVLVSVAIAEGHLPCFRTDYNPHRDPCKLKVHCYGDITNVPLPEDCRSMLDIDLTLVNVRDDAFQNEKHSNFANSVTSLDIINSTSVPMFISNMRRLEHLKVANNNIKHISETSFTHLYNLDSLDLSKNELSDISKIFTFNFHPSLRVLTLAHNEISTINNSTFIQLSSLKELDLSHNLIVELLDDTFDGLASLEILKLKYNKIKHLNGALNSLQSLRQLYLRGNQLINDYINIQSFKMSHVLDVLDVSENNLHKVGSLMSRHWEHLKDVCKINLSSNKITTVPNSTFQRNPQIEGFYGYGLETELDLSKNKINRVEYNAFHSIFQLTNLDLSKNEIKDFFVNPHDLINLKYLNLSSNNIIDINYHSFSSMINLQNMDLSKNRLENIPEFTFFKNEHLKNVNMSYNSMNIIKYLSIKMFHSDGGVLDLSHNDLSVLSIPHGQGIRLTELLLHSNKILIPNDIDLKGQLELQYLDLSKNLIEKLIEQSLQLPENLKKLDLSFNNINQIGPGTFKCVSHLRLLRLQHNHLNNLEYGAFQDLSALEYLDLSFNNITFLDSRVMTDLKSLSLLSLRNNGINYLDYTIWLGHKFDIRVIIDENSVSCDWLGKALGDYNQGYSKMKLYTLKPSINHTSLEGISCESQVGNIIDQNPSIYSETEERLLVMMQKLLQAVNEQTSELKDLTHYKREGFFKQKLSKDVNAI